MISLHEKVCFYRGITGIMVKGLLYRLALLSLCVCVGGVWIQWFRDQWCSHSQWMVTIGWMSLAVGPLRSDSVVSPMLHMVQCAMAGVPALYYMSLRKALTLLRRGNISGRPYCWTMTVTLYMICIYYIYITCMINYHIIILHVFYK